LVLGIITRLVRLGWRSHVLPAIGQGQCRDTVRVVVASTPLDQRTDGIESKIPQELPQPRFGIVEIAVVAKLTQESDL
jgi:hypothetical protein